MNLKSLKDIPASFSLAKRALLFCMIFSIVISLGSMVWAYYTIRYVKNTAYILTKDGQAALISVIDMNEIDHYRKPEILNHINMYHSYFWDIDQFNYKRRIDNALYLAGNSGKELFQTLEASGHFAKIVTENLTQKIEVDSIKIEEETYPYKAEIYGKLHVFRTDQKAESTNKLRAKFILYNVSRTDKNPHGLLIENYHLELNPFGK
jgi:conjugative transposon TraK protein